MSFWLVTDTGSDLPLSYTQKQKDFTILPLTYQIDGKDYVPTGNDAETKAFYAKMRAGKSPTTSQINVNTWKETFEALLKQGHQVLALCFSGGLSGTAEAALTAKAELSSKYPPENLIVIDSMCASLGQGLYVHYALAMREEGKSMADTAKWLTENKSKFAHWFTVDDLQYLRRGGRVSATSAYLGSVLKIKPVLHVDDAGKLIPMEKVQGRKRSLKELVAKMKETAVNPKEQTVFISHGDCEEEAQLLADMIRKELGVEKFMLGLVGPIIGSHSGPGTMALFFLAEHR